VIDILVLDRILFWDAQHQKRLKIRTNIDIYRSNPPGTPLAVVEEKAVNHFSLMQQAEDKKSTGNREIPGKPHDTKQTISSSIFIPSEIHCSRT
jgi:hypothetical protein